MKIALAPFVLALAATVLVIEQEVSAWSFLRREQKAVDDEAKLETLGDVRHRESSAIDNKEGKQPRRLETCSDNPDTGLFDFGIRDCEAFARTANRRGTGYRDRWCSWNVVRDNCPQTCGLCVAGSSPLSAAAASTSLAKVAAYYYPWWGNDFHRGRRYTREFLDPPQMPHLGEYDDTDPAVINQHLLWSRQANIQVWVTSWWGPETREDTTTLNVILPHPNLGDLEISLFYETFGRVKETLDGSGVYSFDNVVPDVEHIADNFFGHPNYLRIGGKPVLFVYVTRFYNNRGLLGEITTRMRQAAASRGYNEIFIVGDQIWRDPPSSPETYTAFDLLDGVTNYDVYGNMREQGDLYARQSRVDLYRSRLEGWRDACGDKCALFPSVGVGLNKKGQIQPLSRQLDEVSPPGSLFAAMVEDAVELVDDAVDRILVVTTFNEWHEDTQIEPVFVNGSATNLPSNITYGLNYAEYGELYLDLLWDGTTEQDPTEAPSVSLVPSGAPTASASMSPNQTPSPQAILTPIPTIQLARTQAPVPQELEGVYGRGSRSRGGDGRGGAGSSGPRNIGGLRRLLQNLVD